MRSSTILWNASSTTVDTYDREEGMTMHIKMNRIVPLAVAGAAALAIAAAPTAAATTLATGSNVNQNPGNAEITAEPGAAAQHAAQLQQPFGGDSGALLYHHFGHPGGAI
jgi:hypothetical protein